MLSYDFIIAMLPRTPPSVAIVAGTSDERVNNDKRDSVHHVTTNSGSISQRVSSCGLKT